MVNNKNNKMQKLFISALDIDHKQTFEALPC